jgi:hypothetical protein
MEHQGHGAGEKKGVMENIKEKLPGGHTDHQQTTGTYGQQGHTGVTGTGTHDTGEKKGVMENVMEKLPGGHTDHQQTTGITGTETHGTTATGGTYGQQGQTGTTGTGTHDTDGTGGKKSIMDKIKDKLPGQH